MRRSLLPLLIALCTVAPLWAQRQYSPNLAVGAKAGATISRMSFSPGIEQTWLPGFMAGVVVRYTEENHCGLIAELNIEQRGWREKYEPGQDFSYQRTLTYLQLPLLSHFYFGSRKFKFFFNAGPEVGYMLGSTIKANFDYRNLATVAGYPQGYRNSEQLDMAISGKFDYGISAGLGLGWKMQRRHSVLIEGRFYYGLGNIFPSSKRDYFSASRGMSIEATAAYLFRVL